MRYIKKAMLISSAIIAVNSTLNANCDIKYSDNRVHYADEHNPQNHIITLNYKNMELLDLKYIEGSTNHHADPMGELNKAKYMMLVPKGSYFVHFYDLKNGNFVKKIRLPFKPRSADAYNAKYNLVFLNSRNRPAGVLIDVDKLEIVGKIGFNIECSTNKPSVKQLWNVYSYKENFDKNYQCLPVDFGGDQISGHPIWISDNALALIDRANRMIHVYQITPNKNGNYDTKKIQTFKTDTSLHQLIPQSKDRNNKIFYGMTEGNGIENLTAGVYKFEVKHNRLKKIAFTKLKNNNYYGTNGHNLYITPDKKYLYAPAGALLKEESQNYGYDWISRHNKHKRLDKNYENFVKLFLRENIDKNEIKNYYKVKKLFNKYSQIDGYTPKYIPSKQHYMANNYYKKQYTLIPNGSIFVIDTKSMKVVKKIAAGKGAGHVAFSEQKGIAVVTNHLDDFLTLIDYKHHKFLQNVYLDFEHENIFNLSQSHMQYISKDGNYYYNFWSDGGVFFRLNLNDLSIDRAVYVGGIPIQGNFYEHIDSNCNYPAPSLDDGFDKYFNIDNITDTFDNQERSFRSFFSRFSSIKSRD